jgi:hypothetical protein
VFARGLFEGTGGLAQAGYNMTWPAWAVALSAMLCVCYSTRILLNCKQHEYFDMVCVTFELEN